MLTHWSNLKGTQMYLHIAYFIKLFTSKRWFWFRLIKSVFKNWLLPLINNKTQFMLRFLLRVFTHCVTHKSCCSYFIQSKSYFTSSYSIEVRIVQLYYYNWYLRYILKISNYIIKNNKYSVKVKTEIGTYAAELYL